MSATRWVPAGHGVAGCDDGKMTGMHVARIGSQQVELPLVPVDDDVTIAPLMAIDHGVEFARTACRELADAFATAPPRS